MTTWTVDELTRIGQAEELDLTSFREDGTSRRAVTMWVARLGDDLYVRAYKGRDSWWFRGTRTRHEGHVRAGGVDRDVTFVDETDPGVNDLIDTAYRTKYRRHSATTVDPMVASDARAATLRLVPR